MGWANSSWLSIAWRYLLTHYSIGWMATVWVYPAEILPLKIRSKGAALAAAADFLGNFLVSSHLNRTYEPLGPFSRSRTRLWKLPRLLSKTSATRPTLFLLSSTLLQR